MKKFKFGSKVWFLSRERKPVNAIYIKRQPHSWATVVLETGVTREIKKDELGEGWNP